MTMREQVALFLFVVLGGGYGLLCLADYVGEILDSYLAREKAWEEIDRRCAMERHPSSQAVVYDQEKEVIATGINSNEWRHYFN